MSTAYDRVEWGFLAAVLGEMGFDNMVIELFMTYISSVRYRISHAGRIFGPVITYRGIRQGDPLSSYLFLICLEGFTALIQSYEQKICWKELRQLGQPLQSLICSLRMIVISSAKQTLKVQHVLTMLQLFEKASSQQINVDTTSILFSKNVSLVLKQELCQQLSFNESGDNNLYLGLLSFLHRKKSVDFGYIKEKLQEIQIKSVTQTLPIYTMNVSLLPLEVYKDLERAMSKFWWKTNSNKDNCIHWKSCDAMFKKKTDVGMGFRSIRDFNIALLGKQA